jgi:hypothetical protein
MSRLPDFVIMGALRSGSTALFRYLSEHPSIYMPDSKELRFFNQRFESGVDWYSQNFAAAQVDQLVGEATPGYMYRAETVDRMAATIPDAELIVILRDPVDRAYSHFWMDTIRGRTELSFEAYLESADQLVFGRYIDSLRQVCQRFERDQLLVLFYEDLRDRPQELYSTACQFIGVDDAFVPPSMGRVINQYVEFRSLTVRDWSNRLPQSLSLAKKVTSRLNTRVNVAYPPMRPETKQWLAQRFEDSNRELALWLDRDLPDWTTTSQGGRR